MEPYVGQVSLFGFSFAPRGWANCNGQLLSIAQNQALFSILGTTYGGDGVSTFGLPDLRGRRALSSGQGPGLSDYELGEKAGVENVTLTIAQMPIHTHVQVYASTTSADASSPQYAIWAQDSGGALSNYSNVTPDKTMAAGAIAATGGNSPHTNLSPELVLNYCIALTGIFPSRN